jgi:hypothetical protein
MIECKPNLDCLILTESSKYLSHPHTGHQRLHHYLRGHPWLHRVLQPQRGHQRVGGVPRAEQPRDGVLGLRHVAKGVVDHWWVDKGW